MLLKISKTVFALKTAAYNLQLLDRFSGRSLMNTTNSNGQSTEPYGTRLVTKFHSETDSPSKPLLSVIV